MIISIKDMKLPHVNKRINICIPEGLVYLVGNNGVGKTLLLDAIAGLYKDKNGKVSGNEDVIYINQSTYFSDKLKVDSLLEFTYFLDGRIRDKRDFVDFLNSFLDSNQIEIVDYIKNMNSSVPDFIIGYDLDREKTNILKPDDIYM